MDKPWQFCQICGEDFSITNNLASWQYSESLYKFAYEKVHRGIIICTKCRLKSKIWHILFLDSDASVEKAIPGWKDAKKPID